jgi:hypothetical protein
MLADLIVRPGRIHGQLELVIKRVFFQSHDPLLTVDLFVVVVLVGHQNLDFPKSRPSADLAASAEQTFRPRTSYRWTGPIFKSRNRPPSQL